MPDFSDIEQRMKKQFPNAELDYHWKWPFRESDVLAFYGEPIGDLTEEEFTERLFAKFNKALTDAVKSRNRKRVLEIIRLIVCKWGGIGGNGDDTLETYANHLLARTPAQLTGMRGIASKSKILAAWDLKGCFIYDARVAIALQTLYFDKYKFEIPTPQGGRNELIRKLAASRGVPVDYSGYCAALRATGHGKQLEKKLFMLGKWIREHA